ncbi:MAG: DUF1922 domain-containing protein [Candidatus Bathyarchaeia archaeon]
MFWVIVCYNCGRLLLARACQKTKICPYCETKIHINKAKKVASGKTAREASVIVRSLKAKGAV